MADYITKGSFNLGNQITLKNKNSNIDRDYGPYEGKTLTEIATLLTNTIQIGKTIGVIESGKVVEYWWQPVDGGYGFVKKGAVEIVVDDELNADSTNPVQNKVITGAIDELAAKTTTPIVSHDSNVVTIQPNVMNVWEKEVTSLEITKGGYTSGIVNNYMIRFKAGEGCDVNFYEFTLQWYSGDEPTWTAGNTYEISIVDDIALWAEFEPKQA